MKSKIDVAALFAEEEPRENKTYTTIKEGLNNFLNDLEGCFRVPCFAKDGMLFCYLAGGSHFIYDPTINKIIKLKILTDVAIRIDIKSLRLSIDCELLKQIFIKLITPTEKSSEKSLIEKYRISKKRIREKDLKLIAKYEQSLKKK